MSLNNGIKTKIWGPKCWFYLHSVTMGYPFKEPSKQKQNEYRQFFKFVGKTLPCGLCRTSYEQFIKKKPFSSTVMKNRKSLVNHLFIIHNLVNKKLKCKQLERSKFNKMYNYYDKFRSKGCSKKSLGCH